MAKPVKTINRIQGFFFKTIAMYVVGLSNNTTFPWLSLQYSHICNSSRTTDTQWSLFLLKSRTFGLEQINSGAFGVFSAKLSAPILVQWVPCPCFPLFNQYFYKKLSLYIHLPNIYLGLGFEFGQQRIRDLAFVYKISVNILVSEYMLFRTCHHNFTNFLTFILPKFEKENLLSLIGEAEGYISTNFLKKFTIQKK